MTKKQENRSRRHRKVRARVSGTSERPRLYVFRSLKHIYAQVIDDSKGVTLVSASERDIEKKGNKSQSAFAVGEAVAKKAKDKKIKEVVFDRGGYLYHGRVRALADGARKGGLKF